MLSSLLILVEMVYIGQRTATQVLVNAGTAPGLGAQVIRMALNSPGCMLGAVSIDSQDRRFSWSPMTPVGYSLRGLVLL